MSICTYTIFVYKINFGFLANTFHTHSESNLELVSGRLLNSRSKS